MLKSEVKEALASGSEWGTVEAAMAKAGIGRSRFYQLLDEHPEIKTLSLKRPGRTKGRRLIYIPSLLNLLDEMATAQAIEKVGTWPLCRGRELAQGTT